MPLQHSLLACHGSLRAIHEIQHPTLWRISNVEAFCDVSAMLPLSRCALQLLQCFVSGPDCDALVKGQLTQ